MSNITTTPCRDRTDAKIRELWGKKVSTLPVCDQLFDLRPDADDVINLGDAVVLGQMTEAECCSLMAKYDVCMAGTPTPTPTPTPQDNTWLFLIGLGLAAAIILSKKK